MIHGTNMKMLLVGLSLVLLGLVEATQIGCQRPLINGREHRVSDNQLSASPSSGSWNFGPARSRLNTEEVPVHKLAGAWCPNVVNAARWIQVDFAKTMYVTGIATRGRPGQWSAWVTNYEIKYSADGRTWKTYTEGTGPKIFRGNWDPRTINKHELQHPFTARYVRLYVRSPGYRCLRWEIYGCPLQDKHCPPGFSRSFTHGTPTYIASTPYQPSCYRFVTTQKNWLEARSECLKIGSDLVSVETAGEQHHLETVIRGNSTLQKPELMDFRQWGYWTSGTDSRNEGSWIWAATGRVISYKNWGNGEPNNNYHSQPENCLELYRRIGYKWNDFDCTNNFLSFICETKAL